MIDEVKIIGRAALPWPDRKRIEVETYNSKSKDKTILVRELSESELQKCLKSKAESLFFELVALVPASDCEVSAVRLYDGKHIVYEDYNIDLINIVGHGK